MYLVNREKETIQECTILKKKTGYTIIAVGNEIYGLPAEDENCCLCTTYEDACCILCGACFVPQ